MFLKQKSIIPMLAVFVAVFACSLAAHAAAPSIGSLSVSSGPEGTAVTIKGTNFGTSQGTVSFNGTAGAPTSWSATSIAVNVPVGATTGPLIVTVGGVASNSKTFSITPAITGLSLNTGPVQMGFVITGTTFGSTQGVVKIGTTTIKPAGILSWAKNSITVQVPAGATSGNVVIVASGRSSNGVPFTVSAFGCN